jgi:AraC family transcriptional regulator of adaptative response/methylated-DNA-[protein]-cysteine methyltransferase
VGRAAAGETIRSVVLPSSLGQVLVAATVRGVCWVALGDDARALETELQRHFANASFEPADRMLTGFARSVLGWIERGDVAPDLPLDLIGTRFQLKVWEELRRLRPGETTSYGELARKLAAPRAARAVGTACGQNPLAVIVPCHRVRRSDGELGGYRWGLERKRELLARETPARGKQKRT